MVIQVRHRGCVPCIAQEGNFTRPVPVVNTTSEVWYRGLKPWERLYSHHTLASARNFSGFKPLYIPTCDLDFVLSTDYDHTTELFPDKPDVTMQPETKGIRTWRRLRNNRELKPERPVPLGHPLFIGGITERKNPNNSKLMNVSHHSPQTNNGYVRQEKDGNIFYY